MIRRPPRSTQSRSSAASDVYKRQGALAHGLETLENRDVACAVFGLGRPYVGVGHRLPFHAPHATRFGSRPTSVHSTRSERLSRAIQGDSGESRMMWVSGGGISPGPQWRWKRSI